MTQTLKNLVESYKKRELNAPYIQVIDRIFSYEMITLPEGTPFEFTDAKGKEGKGRLLDLTFEWAFF